MSTGRAPKVRRFLWRDLVIKTDPAAMSTIETEYVFSNGRKFNRNKTRRTAP